MKETDQPDYDRVLTIMAEAIQDAKDMPDLGDGAARPEQTISEPDARFYARAVLRALAEAGYYPYTAAPTSSAGS